MAESEGYTYRVLVVRTRGETEPVRRHRDLIDLGLHAGATAAAAVDAAIEQGGLPQQDGGRCIAVPASRWHEFDVKIEQVPTVRVLEAQTPEQEQEPDAD